MADTRSHKQKKGVEQRVEEELVPLVLEDNAPPSMDSLMRYILESNKEAERLRKKEVEEAERRQEEREERIENRRRQDLIDAEERQEKREDRLRKQKLEEEAQRLECEKEAREELRKQKIEDEKREYEHQQEMLRLQATLGERAETARREEAEKCRKREKAISAIQSYKDVDDIEVFLASAEKKLMAGGIPEEEWGFVISAKLSGRQGAAWEDLQVEGADYRSMKTSLLSICGYTPKIAGDLFFGFRQEALRGMTADHLWRRGVQLFRRMVAPDKAEPSLEFSVVKAWILSVVPRGTRLLLDSRIIANQTDLILALQDHLVIEGEKGEGQVAVFGEQHHGPEHGSGERRPVGCCYRCGKPGHKVADCWQKNESGSGESAKPSAGGSAKPIICFYCGVEGHRSPQCPKKGQEEPKPKEGQGQPKLVPVRRVKVVSPRENKKEEAILDGIVNGRETAILLDSGTAISVVPAEWVEKELETGEEVPIVAFGSEGPVYLPVARVQFKVRHLEWEEEVALNPTVEGQETDVLCRLDLTSVRGANLISILQEREKEQGAEAQKQEEEEKDKAAVATPAGSEAVGTDDGVMAADRPVRIPESGPPAEEVEHNSDFELEEDLEAEDSLTEEEATDLSLLADEKEVEKKELSSLKPKGREDNDLVVPSVEKDSSHRAELVEEVFAAATEDIFELDKEEDLRPSLAEEKDDDLDLLAEVEEEMVELVAEEKEEEHSLAEGKEESVEEKSVCLKPEGREEIDLVVPPGKSGNSSRSDLVEETKTSSRVDLEEENLLLGLPVKLRKEEMSLAQDLEARKIKDSSFSWPEIAKEAEKCCKASDSCQRDRKKQTSRKKKKAHDKKEVERTLAEEEVLFCLKDLFAVEEDDEEEEVLFCLKPKGRADNDLVISGKDDVLGPKPSENCEGIDGSVVGNLKSDVFDGSIVENLKNDVFDGSIVENLRSDAFDGSIVENLKSDVFDGSIVENWRSDAFDGSIVENLKSDGFDGSVIEKLKSGAFNGTVVENLKSDFSDGSW